MAGIYLAIDAQGQGKPQVTFDDFSGGLNTKTNPFLLKPNELAQAHNWLLDAEYGSLVLRNGDLARTDSLTKTIPSDITWRCIIADTGNWIPGAPIKSMIVTLDCDSSMPDQNGFLDGQTVDSLLGAVTFFTINFSFQNGGTPDSQILLDVDTLDINNSGIAIGDSAKIVLTQADFTQAIDTGGVTGLYAFYSQPTTKSLLYVIPGFGSQNQWSSLYASRSQQYNPVVKLADFLYKGETPIWETWNGFVYVALPRQRPLITNGTRTVHLVPRAPGQIEIVPAQPDTPNGAWTIDGSVRYGLFRRAADTGAGLAALMDRVGYISHKVPVFNEWNLLFGFPREIGDTLAAAATGPIRSDSVLLYVTRTRGNPEQFPQFIDSLFIIDSIISGTPAILDTFKMLDSIPNDSLGTTSYPFVGLPSGLLPYDTGYVDSATFILTISGGADRSRFFTAPGQPTLIKQEHTVRADDWWPSGTESDTGNLDHIGWAYAVTKFDTLIGLMSDTSPNLIISTGFQVDFGNGKDSTSAITINVPQLTDFDTGQVRIVWRAQIKNQQIGDSVIVTTDTFLIIIPGEPVGTETIVLTISSAVKHVIHSSLLPVGVLHGKDDTLFIDSVNWRTWSSGGAIDKSIDLDRRFSAFNNFHAIESRTAILKGFFAFKGSLFGWTDGRLFRSTLNKPVFAPFNDIRFDVGGGQVIVQVTNIGPNILVMLSDGQIELYDPVSGLPTKGSFVDGVGCIAPQSLITRGGIAYWMSNDGIRTASIHPVKSFGVPTRIISTKINDLIVDGRSDSLKSTMAAGIGPDGKTIIFCYPSIDTMFIYYPELDAWTTRSGSFFQATNYDTTTVEGLLHSSKMVYAKTGDERVFELYASPTYYDSGLGTSVVGTFETRPFFTDPSIWQVTQVGMLRGVSKNAVVSILNDSASQEVTETFQSTDPRYSIHGLAFNEGSFMSLRYSTSSIQPTLTDTVRRIDIWGRVIGHPIVK